MGQVALGLRSLLVKLGVFFVLAALLAWALGGTLWPRPEVVDGEAIAFAGERWFWRLEVGGREAPPIRWMLMHGDADGAERPQPVDQQLWDQVAGPIIAGDRLYYAGLPHGASTWRIESRGDAAGAPAVHPMPDRLAVEQQLARAGQGLPIQSEQAIRAQRAAVLDPE